MASAAPGSRQPYGHGGKAPRGALDIAALITWAIKTATRRGKIAAMRWEHRDRRARVLLIPETKNGTPRRIRSPRRRSRSWMGFPGALTAMCGGVKPNTISQAFEQICRATGVEGLTFHDLRREATSRLFEKGLHPMLVAAITGHCRC